MDPSTWSSGHKATLSVDVIFFVLTWLAVSLRVYVRAGMLRAFGWDDWTMLITQLMFTGYLSCEAGGVHFGVGEHMADLEPWRAERVLLMFYLCEIFYVLSTCLLKISVGFFLLRVAFDRIHIFIIRALMVASACLGVVFSFILVFQCWPIADWWSLDPHAKSCINPSIVVGLTYAVSALNVCADWTMGILPWFIVRGLQMPKSQKRMVAGLLSFAAMGSTATIVRLPYIQSLSQSFDGREGDFLYNSVGMAIWSTVEVGIGVTAASLATLRPLMKLAAGRFGRDRAPDNRRGHEKKQYHVRKLNTWPDDFNPGDPARGQTTTVITGGKNPGLIVEAKFFESNTTERSASVVSEEAFGARWRKKSLRTADEGAGVKVDLANVEKGVHRLEEERERERRTSAWSTASMTQ